MRTMFGLPEHVVYATAGVWALLALATALVLFLRWRRPGHYDELVSRTASWWWMIGAFTFAIVLDTTVAITGEVDLVTHGGSMCMVHNGHSLMGYVTGTGCTATALIGAFLAVNPNTVEATAAALAYFGLAGEKAAILGQDRLKPGLRSASPTNS